MDIMSLKGDFPIFKNIASLVYLDSTATSLKPKSVIEKEVEYYEKYSANVFRGVYKISEKATEEYEETREIVAKFISAKKPEEVIFTRSTTECLNLVAYSMGRKIVEAGDEIVTTIMEHHSNFVPWQQLALENGATFKVIDVTDEGYLQIGNLDQIITKKTKILTLTYVSNVLGTINPLKEIVKTVKSINPKVIVVVDAAQAVPHMKVNVQELGCDFLAFSSHKMLGPTGVGVLWGRYELLEEMFPFNYGGEMIQEVYIDRTVFKLPPHKFEAGTPHIAGIVALKEAINYLEKIGMERIRKHEIEILEYALNHLLSQFKGMIQILGPNEARKKSGIIAFTFDKFHPHDVAQILDEDDICIRVGHHCAMPLHERLTINASCRASFYIYNSKDDVDKLIKGLHKVKKTLS
ncbi:cysteine desulfurase [Candidatus Roizmanbacteria bacterium]|nr:cysteine desulfurase [Candidatus Roizmanbacteria bacterium]